MLIMCTYAAAAVAATSSAGVYIWLSCVPVVQLLLMQGTQFIALVSLAHICHVVLRVMPANSAHVPLPEPQCSKKQCGYR
jgi:hypothetical protein